MIDYDNLYDRLFKYWRVKNFTNKVEVIKKCKSFEHKFDPNKGTKKLTYMAIVMKSCMMREYKKKQDRIKNRIKKLNKLGIN